MNEAAFIGALFKLQAASQAVLGLWKAACSFLEGLGVPDLKTRPMADTGAGDGLGLQLNRAVRLTRVLRVLRREFSGSLSGLADYLFTGLSAGAAMAFSGVLPAGGRVALPALRSMRISPV